MTNLQISLSSSTIEQLFVFAFLSFVASMALTPLYTTAAFNGKWWKKARTTTLTGETAKVYQKLHAAKHTRNIPTMAGIIFVLATIIVTVSGNLNRSETWLPLAAMGGAALIGLVDDIINIRGVGGGIAGMRAKMKSLLLVGISFIGGWWFFSKLGFDSLHIPFYHTWHIGWLIIPLFIFVIFCTANAVNISDGLDGLAGGLAAIAFAAYALISLIEHKYSLAGFCMTIVGALLSYTWFNIFPARFFMGDVGSFALGTALGKKIFLSSPIHHHLEAVGWPETKITMRFWVLGEMAAFVGVTLFLLGGH
jgi:phospho-N-acetylmuramoyl-pentapeptide-transferase